MVKVKFVEIEDLNKVPAYIYQVHQETEFLWSTYDELSRDDSLHINKVKANMESIDNVAICAIDGDRIVGLMNFNRYGRRRFRHAGEIGISILKEYYGQGVATQMLELLFEWCKSNQVTKIDLSVMEHNLRAISLYKRLGFEYEGERKRAVYMHNQYYSFIEMGKSL